MNKNAKNIIIIAVIGVIIIGVYFLGGMMKKHKRPSQNTSGMNMEKMLEGIEGIPDGPPAVTGQFVAVDGDQIIIERVVGDDGPDRGEMQKSMQSLSDGGRQQMREARRAERESAEKEKVFVTISDKTDIIKVDESGSAQKISTEELGENKNVMIWKEDDNAVLILQNNMGRGNKS